MANQLTNIPTNLIMGFLGVGKTTAILDLLKHKPNNENWAVLVNEFGKIGIDGAIYKAAGVSVKEIAGGCLCCAVGLPFQVSINRLLKDQRPDRLLIEPSGLGHPKKVIEMLVNDSFKQTLDLRASICLVDPEKFKDNRYTTHESFIDQIALSDVLVANKIDLADLEAIDLFYQWAKYNRPAKSLVAQTTGGQIDVNWLNITRNTDRLATFPNSHQINKLTPVSESNAALENMAQPYQSFGLTFPIQSCFDYKQLNLLLKQTKIERIKGIVNTNNGWFIINAIEDQINYVKTTTSTTNRIEIIFNEDIIEDFSNALKLCISVGFDNNDPAPINQNQ